MLGPLDNAIIVFFVLLVLSIGYYFSKTAKDMESYYLANRSLPWSLVVGTLAASWYGGIGVVGTVGYAAVYGLSTWAIWSIGAHLIRMPLALWVGPRIQIRTDITVPDLLESLYGRKAALLGAVLMFFVCAQIGEITAVGYIGEAAWGVSNVTAGTIMVALVVVLTVLGGLMGVAVTDMLLFFCMIFSVTMVFPGLFGDIGGWAGLRTALGENAPLMHPTGGMSFWKAVMLVVFCFSPYADPTFYQRFSAAHSPKVGRRALLTCFCIWIAFDIVICTTGVIVKALYPDAQPEVAYVRLVLSHMPVGIRGLFIVGLVGAIISTLDSYYLVGGTTLANDIYARARGIASLPQKTIVAYTRLAVVLLGIIGLSVAFRFKLAYDAFLFVGSIWMSAAFVPIVGGLVGRGRKTETGGILSMVVGGGLFGLLKLFPEITAVEPLLLALPASFLAWLIGNRIGEDRNGEALKA
ncbi:sodium:solute symporter family protein [Aminithiophilus ramosus]|uniref:Sodium:solute symporter family protein n=1 Tax=Aminithiophilus ramosus TaxID=3029084 RepID=A0A9Q7ACS7_9BACT|nr:sodium:solute symporter family protein [Aminithiophilus ramosus]QTX32039.1 sodium:solute symporter family protein [Aminithiophilus ramosus]